MNKTPPTPAELLEARSLAHARDTVSLRLLTSGRWAVYDRTFSLLGVADDLEGIARLAEPLRALAAAAAQRLADELSFNQRRAADRASLDAALQLEISLDDLEL